MLSSIAPPLKGPLINYLQVIKEHDYSLWVYSMILMRCGCRAFELLESIP